MKIILTICAVICLATGTAQAAEAPATGPHTYIPSEKEHPDLIKLRLQMRSHRNLPPISFWLAVAQCETRQEWDRGKQWSHRARAYVRGGLGIAWRTTWRGYGGLEFAKTPAHASKWAQIIVANRIGFIGWQTDEYLTLDDKLNNRPFYRPAAGFSQGWGGTCRTAWLKKNPLP